MMYINYDDYAFNDLCDTSPSPLSTAVAVGGRNANVTARSGTWPVAIDTGLMCDFSSGSVSGAT